jgi:hypothetical protein
MAIKRRRDGGFVMDLDDFKFFGEKLAELATALEEKNIEVICDTREQLSVVHAIAEQMPAVSHRHYEALYKPANELTIMFRMGERGWPLKIGDEEVVAAKNLAEAWTRARDVLVDPEETPVHAAPSLEALLVALERFPDAMVPLRLGRQKKPGRGLKPRPAYPLGDEYDIQDALWLYLKMTHADARREDPTPTTAGSSSKIDFTIPSLSAGLEVKYARADVEPATLKKDLLRDIHDAAQRDDIKHLVILVAEASEAIGRTSALSDLEGADKGINVRLIRFAL